MLCFGWFWKKLVSNTTTLKKGLWNKVYFWRNCGMQFFIESRKNIKKLLAELELAFSKLWNLGSGLENLVKINYFTRGSHRFHPDLKDSDLLLILGFLKNVNTENRNCGRYWNLIIGSILCAMLTNISEYILINMLR